MARTARITSDMLITAGTELVLENGLSALNIRSVAAKLNCSIQPIFRNFGNMDALRKEIYRAINDRYWAYIVQFIDKTDYLFTISLAHIRLAEEQPNLFSAMFLTDRNGSLTVAEILSAGWNRETIECTAQQFDIPIEAAEAVYRDVRFYTFGIAREVYAGAVKLQPGETETLLRGAIESFCRTAQLRKE